MDNTTPQTHKQKKKKKKKKELQHLGTASRKTTGAGGLNYFFLTRNLPFDSDVAKNYRCMFVPHRGPLPQSETNITKSTMVTQSKVLKGDRKPEQKKPQTG